MDIIIQSGPERGRKFTIQGTDAIIGRRSHCDVCLQDERLSGQHAQLHYEHGQWYVFDLNSSNGTWVNRQRLYQKHKLQPGDEVGVGKTVMRFENLGMGAVAAMAPAPMYDIGAPVYNADSNIKKSDKSATSGKMRVLPLFLLLIVGIFIIVGSSILAWGAWEWGWEGGLRDFLSSGIPAVLGLLLLTPWGMMGVMGGVNMTIKRFRGTSSGIWSLLIFLFGLIPLAFWFMFLALTSLFGVWAWNASLSMLPSKRRCEQCRGWNDYTATRCQHCRQPLN